MKRKDASAMLGKADSETEGESSASLKLDMALRERASAATRPPSYAAPTTPAPVTRPYAQVKHQISIRISAESLSSADTFIDNQRRSGVKVTMQELVESLFTLLDNPEISERVENQIDELKVQRVTSKRVRP